MSSQPARPHRMQRPPPPDGLSRDLYARRHPEPCTRATLAVAEAVARTVALLRLPERPVRVTIESEFIDAFRLALLRADYAATVADSRPGDPAIVTLLVR